MFFMKTFFFNSFVCQVFFKANNIQGKGVENLVDLAFLGFFKEKKFKATFVSIADC